MGRNHWLDFLKLTFILVIAFLHTAWWTSMKYGFLPVEFFFIVSGFYVYVSYAFKRYKFGKFIIKKIMRVFPAYLLILLIYAGYSLAFPQFYSESSYDHWGLSFIRELFMLQGVGLTELFHVRCMVILQSAWYVSVYFYGAILLYWLLVNVTRKVAICIFSVIVIGVYGFFFLLWGSTLEIWTYKGFFYMPLWRGLAGMSAGILLGMALRRENVAGWLATHKFFFNILSIVALAGAFYSFFSPTDIEWVGIICFICILANAVSPDGIGSYFNKWGGEYVKCIPDISFEILLLHKILIPVSVKISDYLGVLYIDAAKYAVYAVLVVMAGFIFNRYITPQVKKMFGCAASLLHLSV